MLGQLRESAKRWAKRYARARNGSANRASVLCYHSVHPTSPTASVSTVGFRAHLEWLSDHCDVVPFEQVQSFAGRDALDRPVVALTFDDAFADNYEHAWPVLSEFGLPATLFVATGLVERRPAVLARFARLLSVSPPEIQPLSWSQIGLMRDGGMSIGAHSVTPPAPALFRTGRGHADRAQPDRDLGFGRLVRARDF